jgi:tellurite resistance protein TerB
MPMEYMRSTISIHDPFDRGDAGLKALLTASSFVALADGWVAKVERDAAVQYIQRRRIAPIISAQRIAEIFDQRVQRLMERDSADLIVEALRPAGRLSLTSDVTRVGKEVAAADGHIHPEEIEVIRLIRLITMSFQSHR